MTNEITEVRDGAIIAAEINTIKNRTKREVLAASIEIGQRLCEAKELVPYGDWERWLHDRVDYSQSTANNLMRIFTEYGDNQIDLLGASKSQTFGNLTYSQAIALFALPAEEREDFVKENPVEDMTARQLQEAIKGKEQAEKEKADAIAEKEKVLNQAEGQKKLYENANIAKTEAEKKLQEETERFKEELAAAIKPEATGPSKDELKKLRADVRAKVEKEYKSQVEQISLEKKTAEDAKAEVEAKYQKELKQLKLDNESIIAKQKAAEKQLALAAPETQKFTVYFESFQREYQNMQAALKSLTDSGNAETADKLRGALSKIIAGMVEKPND